ncbi:MAG: DNA-formamidopyrimidine glycosylase [Candidatus Moraniibacteriota bacterium]
MPELPEVETIISDLNKKIKGAVITDFWSDFSKAIKGSTLEKFKREMRGKKILKAERVGKNILINLSDNKTLHIHLRMTGHLLVKDKSKKLNQKNFADKVNQYIHHIWKLDKDKTLEFSDLRKFATITLFDTNEISNYLADKKIGIDALDKKFTFVIFNQLLNAKPKMPIGIFLLDQSIISGIGNIYRSEILFASGVLPERKNESLNKIERKKIFVNTEKILKLAIKMRGTSDSDYRDSSGAPGHFQKMLKVYRKDKTPCSKCGNILLRKKMAQRSVFYCANCQK